MSKYVFGGEIINFSFAANRKICYYLLDKTWKIIKTQIWIVSMCDINLPIIDNISINIFPASFLHIHKTMKFEPWLKFAQVSQHFANKNLRWF